MNYIKKISFVLIILVILGNSNVFAGDTKENIIKCIGKEGFELYTCEKKQICKESDFGKQTKKIVLLNKKYNKEISYNEAQDIYKFNQNSIYKCGILNSQDKAFKELIQKLLKTTDKTNILKVKVLPKIKQKIKQLEKIKNKNKCTSINNKNIIKKIVLDQSTLEYCNYNYFLKYLDYIEKNNLKKNIPKKNGTQNISNQKINKIILKNKNIISNEIKHINKMYSIAYETYIQYDSYIKIHIMLELLKEDYRTFRDKLYQTLHPINQVIYKVINAQSK